MSNEGVRSFVKLLRANIGNKKLSDKEFREFIRNSLPVIEGELAIWTIYEHPKDYPNKFIARKFIRDKPTSDIKVGETLVEVRGLLPIGLTRMDRNIEDDPVIVETWI